jgi:hypothetical protein
VAWLRIAECQRREPSPDRFQFCAIRRLRFIWFKAPAAQPLLYFKSGQGILMDIIERSFTITVLTGIIVLTAGLVWLPFL